MRCAARFAAVVAAALFGTFATRARAEVPDSMRATRDMSKVTLGMAEFGVGFFTLPGAQVCIERQAGCRSGDSSLALSAWPLFRRGAFAAGAGVMLGVTSSTDAPHNDPPDVPRDHSRRYFSVEITGRYYLPLGERFDGWVGVMTGLGVVDDIFQSQKGLSDYALVGPRSSVLLTEGFTLGAGAGVAYEIAERWLLGANVRVSNWFLPSTPLRDPLGDEASLRGNVTAIDLGITIAYRSRLVF